MKEQTESIDHETEFLQYVSSVEFATPQETISQSIKGGLGGLWKKIRNWRKKEQESTGKAEEELQLLPDAFLDRIAPYPDWEPAVKSLKKALDKSCELDKLNHEKQNGNFTILVVGMPQSGNSYILNLLAKELNWRLITAPSAEQIFSNDPNWIKQIDENETPWIIPELEKCYFRHSNGLALVRQLLYRLSKELPPYGIIGCDSWAWAYLKYIIPGRLTNVLVAQSYDGNILSDWFQQIALKNSGRHIIFRQTDNGKLVLSPKTGPADSGVAEIKMSPFINQLAAYCFGIPLIALSVWRCALKKEPDDEMIENISTENNQGKEKTIWVSPWDKIFKPSVPSGMGSEAGIIMHSLLLHNGISQELLHEILPFSSNAIMVTLQGLRDAGLILEKDNLWEVAPCGYPVARRYLGSEGFLTDKL